MMNKGLETQEDVIATMKSCEPSKRHDIIEQLLERKSDIILEADDIAAQLALTNAVSWGCDEIKAAAVKLSENSCKATVDFHLAGTQVDNTFYAGTSLYGTAIIEISRGGKITISSVDRLKMD